MLSKLFTLVPERVNFENFWVEIRKRNKWLINLRFFAVLLLLGFVLFLSIVKSYFPELAIETTEILLIAISIFFYNILFLILWNKFPEISKKFNLHSLHFSLLQIITDFIFLILLIYFTGGVESPFNAFFVFHLIIGSLILPGPVISLIIGITILVLVTLAWFEYNYLLPHHFLALVARQPLFDDPVYLIVFFSTFTVVVFISIYLANSIARVLYQREKELYQAYQELEEAEKTKSRYVMTVVHDLKTPISAALTWVDLIANKNLGEIPEFLRNPLDRIQTRLNNALELISDILTISQIKLSIEVAKDEVELIGILKDLYLKYQVLIDSKNLEYRISSKQESINIFSNQRLLEMAFSNIVSNAIKFNEPNGIIEVILTEKDDCVEVSVADNGIGIKENELSKIFNEFYRTNLAKERKIEGTGLGMTLVKEIITKLGGDIFIYSPSYLGTKERRGTQVLVKLPK